MWDIGVNTWVWTSPLTDDGLAVLAPKVRAWGFDVIELPVVEYAAAHDVRVAVEPLNRYETSVINTVEQALEALDGLPGDGCGLAGHPPREHRGVRAGEGHPTRSSHTSRCAATTGARRVRPTRTGPRGWVAWPSRRVRPLAGGSVVSYAASAEQVVVIVQPAAMIVGRRAVRACRGRRRSGRRSGRGSPRGLR